MDYVWGTSVPLHEDNVLNQERWVNQGILGEMLQELRDDWIEYEVTRSRSTEPEHLAEEMDTTLETQKE